MSTLADPREMHDLLEESYFAQMAQGGGRWFSARTAGYVLAGFAGLDSPTMSRVGLVDVDEARVAAMLDHAKGYFGERRLPWCVHVTPFTRPSNLASLLRQRGFHVASDLEVMTWEGRALPEGAPDVTVERLSSADAAAFTAVLLEGFSMPARYLAPLADITRGWVDHGGTAYLARIDGEPAGTALLARAGEVATVYNVATLRGNRRRGVAGTLMRELLADYLDQPARVLSLQVARASVAERMYHRMGFVARYGWELYTRS